MKIFGLGGRERRFRVLVKGVNVLLKDVDTSSVERLGFYATRIVNAPNADAAAEEARTMIVGELERAGVLNERSNPPMLEVEVGLIRFRGHQPRGGYGVSDAGIQEGEAFA